METDETIGTSQLSSSRVAAHPSGIVPVLQYGLSQCHLAYRSRNIVATANLGVKLDLKKIALQAKNAEYNPKVCVPCVDSKLK